LVQIPAFFHRPAIRIKPSWLLAFTHISRLAPEIIHTLVEK